MDLPESFEGSYSTDRLIIQELVELRQYKTERDELRRNNRKLIAQLSDMEVRITELEAILEAKDYELRRTRTERRSSVDLDRLSTQSQNFSLSQRKSECSWDQDEIQSLREALEAEKQARRACEVKYSEVLTHCQAVTAERDKLKHEVVPSLKARLNKRGPFAGSLTESSETDATFSPPLKPKSIRRSRYTPSYLRVKRPVSRPKDQLFAHSSPGESGRP